MKKPPNEVTFYDENSVYEESLKLHRKYDHIFKCKNSLYAEQLFSEYLKKELYQKEILEYGCGNGWLYSTLNAFQPRKIVGIDISKQTIANANEKRGSNAEYFVMDAHKTAFKDESFDVIVGRAILHHLEYDKALHEIHRLLKRGGVALFVEPLYDNPLGILFRKFTSKARTNSEKPLSRKQIVWGNALFSKNDHFFYNLFSIPTAMISSLFFKKADNFLNNYMHYIDLASSRTTLKYWMRQVVLKWIK